MSTEYFGCLFHKLTVDRPNHYLLPRMGDVARRVRSWTWRTSDMLWLVLRIIATAVCCLGTRYGEQRIVSLKRNPWRANPHVGVLRVNPPWASTTDFMSRTFHYEIPLS